MQVDIELLTIGGYGFDAASFAEALVNSKADTFVDVRQRRGVRGTQYAFLNSQRLQRLMQELGIRYLHFRHLAPSKMLRAKEVEADIHAGTGKRCRGELSREFRDGYRDEVLHHIDAQQLFSTLGDRVRVVVFFCVERAPAACHRSILTTWLAAHTITPIRHLLP